MVKLFEADPLAGLLIAVPNGWLFHVIPASVQFAVTLNASTVRQLAGRPVAYIRNVARRTVAVAGMAGVHSDRSKRM